MVEQKRQGSHWVVNSTIDTVFLSRCAMLSSTSLTRGLARIAVVPVTLVCVSSTLGSFSPR